MCTTPTQSHKLLSKIEKYSKNRSTLYRKRNLESHAVLYRKRKTN